MPAAVQLDRIEAHLVEVGHIALVCEGDRMHGKARATEWAERSAAVNGSRWTEHSHSTATATVTAQPQPQPQPQP